MTYQKNMSFIQYLIRKGILLRRYSE